MSLSGFRTYVQTGIVLQVAASPVINVVSAVGALEESVTVEAAAPLVDVQSSGISDVVQNEEILALPLNGRNAVELVMIAGAAVQTITSHRSGGLPGGIGISVAGGQSFGVAYLLDGAMHNNPQDNLNLPFPFPDALQEFSVATSGLTAQNGMHSGAAVNAVTKSGTNRFSGNAVRVLPRSPLQRHRTRSPRWGRTASLWMMGCSVISSAARSAGRSCTTSSFSSAAYPGHQGQDSSRPPISPGCRPPRCWPATSRHSRLRACNGGAADHADAADS